MPLKLYNSGSHEKEVFRSITPKSVKMYVCGITPYDTTHLGHAFTYVSFDVLQRYLMHKGYKVTYTQNVTDIDDDILRRAEGEGRSWMELGDFWTEVFLNDMKRLNVIKPTHYVKATGSMKQILKMVGELADKGFAYHCADKIYFDVSKFKDYGNLSHFNQMQMKLLLKERGGDPDDPNKKNPLDFVLWTKSKDGEPFWESRWGRGRPGWHIECSAMINKYLGEKIDIHGGGRDLIFPHHESEIAQSESFTGKAPFSRYFMHTAMVMYMGEKMAKSLGNLVLVSQLLKKHSPNAVRWLLLSHHYRQVWDYDPDDMKDADFYSRKIDGMKSAKGFGHNGMDMYAMARFESLMDDDLNTPEVLRTLKALFEDRKADRTSARMLKILGFFV